MSGRIKILIIVTTVAIGAVVSSGCDKIAQNDPGFLEGKISIGPLCPVEQNPPDSACLPTADTYKAYPVGIWTAGGNRFVTQVSPAIDGTFKTELLPGIYTVRLDKGIYNIGSSNLPVEVRINSGKETMLNISIDTGIR